MEEVLGEGGEPIVIENEAGETGQAGDRREGAAERVALEVQLRERGEGGQGGGQGPGDALIPESDGGDPPLAAALAGDAVEGADVAAAGPGRGQVGQGLGEVGDGALVGGFCGGGGQRGEEEEEEREDGGEREVGIPPHGGRIGGNAVVSRGRGGGAFGYGP